MFDLPEEGASNQFVKDDIVAKLAFVSCDNPIFKLQPFPQYENKMVITVNEETRRSHIRQRINALMILVRQ